MARLNQAPVCFTLAQMRFNPVLDMSSMVPALQQDFRLAGYPDYESAIAQTIEFQPEEGGGFAISPMAATRHIFRNKGQTAALVLDSGSLTYELTDYPVFEEFSAAFLGALKIVHAHRAIEYSDRLGMRMLDAIQPKDGENLDRYVVPQTTGLAELMDAGMEFQHAVTDSVFKKEQRTLRVRTMRAPRGFLAPSDLTPLRLKVAPRFLEHRGEALMVDSDSFREGRCDFSMDVAREELAELKGALARTFKAVVTDHARRVWE